MTVYAFGDSYTFGYDLSDFDGSNPSKKTYAALIANALNTDYSCHAMGSYANNAVSRQIISNIDRMTDKDLVLTMWTFANRREFLFDGELGFRSVTPSWNHEFSNCYYKWLDTSQSYHVAESLKEIYIAQQLLTHKNIPFVFVSAVTELSSALIYKDLRDSILPYIDTGSWLFLEQGFGFDDWARHVLKLKYFGHPPDTAHAVLSNLILQKINEQSI